LPRGPAFAEFLNKYASQDGAHPEEPLPGAAASGGGHATEGKG